MRILIAGATGVLGRALIPHLPDHEILGTTRAPDKRAVLTALGARAEVCDVYEAGAFARVAAAFAPEIVVNFLTDLANGPGPANHRIRTEGGPVVAAAAVACGARRLVVESLAFATSPASSAAVASLEANALATGLEVVILRFGLLWGPATWYASRPDGQALHVDEAGRQASALLLGARPGIYAVT
ncbi:MAG: NAD-dependent epimerase/dehydratase family protein [Myxococcales bacterium]|nr:NAD-dependent epimerase/dehydratase family protein [Myxococcales bacterium]